MPSFRFARPFGVQGLRLRLSLWTPSARDGRGFGKKERTMSHSSKFDIHQEITNRIVDALEHAGDFQLPWISRTAGSFARPVNTLSGNPYNGVNVISLWVSAIAQEFPSNVWGTYRQWQTKGCQVRKGEKASLIVFYKPFTVEPDQTADDGDNGERVIARASWVFNAAQTEGYEAPHNLTESDALVFDHIVRAEAFAAATGARIEERGERACYIPSQDIIRIPERARFTGSETSSPAEAFYSTLCHELTHWSGASSRLDRDLSGRFGGEAYAMEELVAELSAAFLCGDLGITLEPLADHACYIKNWLSVLKNDRKAIFTAASKASEAAQWLLAHEQSVSSRDAA
jgi:antirestriction protein ArdC